MTIELDGASLQEGAMDGLTLREVWVGAEKIWPTRETVQITLGPGFQARDELRAALAARGLDYTTVTELPFDIELVGSGNAQQLFYGCSALRSIPPFDMSQVTNANGMFQMCSSLVTVPPLDMSNVWNAPSLFAYCSSLTSVPTMDTSSMTNMGYMFTGCVSLTTVPEMDTSIATDMSSMFRSCTRLTHVPDLNTGSATNVNHMFYGCTSLTDGNVLLIGRHPQVNATNMILNSGLTREPWDIVPPRQVTIKRGSMSGFEKSSTGDASLIGGWPTALGGEQGVSFSAPVTCDTDVRIVNAQGFTDMVRAGTTIPAGTMVLPGYTGLAGDPLVFTEVL